MTTDEYARLNELTKQYQEQASRGADNGVLDSINSQIMNIGKTAVSATGATTPTTSASASGTSGIYQGATSQQDYINQLYAAQEAQKQSALKSAYDANVNSLNTAAAKIPDTFNTARNATAATSEQNRAAFNERAAATGLNSGAGGQADLAMRNVLTSNLSALDKQQAASIADIEAQRTQLASDYSNAIAQANAENDTARAQTLYQEATRVDNSLAATSQAQTEFNYQKQLQDYANQKTQADTLAAYGDFSGYKALGYTDAQIAQMYQTWARQNPLLATGIKSSYTGSSNGNNNNNNNNNNLFGTGSADGGIADTTTQGAFGGATKSDISTAQVEISRAVASGQTLSQIGSQLYTKYQNGEIDNKTFGTYMAAIQIAARK